jgi:autophagy-related protein 101
MNLAKVTLEELEVDEQYVGDVLKCLLHTIVFHRSLGEITPSDTECEYLPELRYVSTTSNRMNGNTNYLLVANG